MVAVKKIKIYSLERDIKNFIQKRNFMRRTYNTYKKSGVNMAVADKLVSYISKISRKTYKKTTETKSFKNIGSFGSIYDLSQEKLKKPIIVSSTDGVGTKIEIANKFKKFNTIGIDLVAMCVNDLIVQGAKPIFFLDYIAVNKIKLPKVKKIINGIINGCKIAECALVGGETAEMPGTYSKNKFDLAGFAVGVVDKDKLLTKNKIKNNDVVLAVPSSGLHSNGFSLVRHILNNKKNIIPNNIKKELLKPTKIYVQELNKINKKNLISGCANITGGGLVDNIIRVIPNHLTLNINLSNIKVNRIFKWLKTKKIQEIEMLKTFNCGVGFCLIAKKNNIKKIKKVFSKKYEPYPIGYISKENKKFNLFGKIKW
jgi:phosphoribosylformylglycinamidine cyclo-ligase|tara:strand:+ start:111 stop:1220 length:1110 start_codon:yes stop_codon:yes gene_type:complete